MSKDNDIYKQTFGIILESQKEGFELCIKMIEGITKHLQPSEQMLLQAVIVELEKAKEEVYKTENE